MQAAFYSAELVDVFSFVIDAVVTKTVNSGKTLMEIK